MVVQRGVRLVIGKDKQTLTEQEMRQREIMRIARLLVRLEKERRKLRRRLKDIGNELRILRRAHKIVCGPVRLEEFDSAEVKS